MNWFDSSILNLVNGFAHRSPVFDSWVVGSEACLLLKGGVILALVWWAWFLPEEGVESRRESLSFTLFASILSLVIARALALLLPFRVRPIHVSELHIRLAYGLDPTTLINWSSFPSDHAAIFSALAMGLFFVSRRAGVFSLAWTFVVICLPRIYLGYHYPTDILAGAAIGIGIASLGKFPVVRSAVTSRALRWKAVHPASFYAFFFVASYEIAENLNSVRQLGTLTLHTALHMAAKAPIHNVASLFH